MTQKKLISIFLLFIIGSIYGIQSVDFIQNDKALSTTFKWCTVPSIIMSLFYGYYGTFGYDKAKAAWKNVVGLLTLTVICTLMFLVSFQGYLILFNCNFETQESTTIKGKVTELDYPKSKKPFNDYAIVIRRDINGQVIKLTVPTNTYVVGQPFEKQLTLGSLGFLYSRQ